MGNCDGNFTWSRGVQKTTIDYVLIGGEWKNRIKNIKIWDEEEAGCDTDHNMMIVKIGGFKENKRMEGRKGREGGWDINKKKGLINFAGLIENEVERESIEVSYNKFMVIIETAASEALGVRKIKNKRHKRWDNELHMVVKERKKANREYKKKLKEGATKEEIEEKWEKYIQCKKEARIKINEYRKRMDKQMMRSIKADGNEGCKKFWNYVKNRMTERVEEECGLERNGMVVLDEKGLKEILNDYARDMQGKKEEKYIEKGEEKIKKNINGNKVTIEKTVFDRALKKLKNGKARGLDGVASEMIKVLGEKGREYLKKCIEDMINIGEFPEEWKETRVKLIFKGKGKNKRKLESYRPIAVTSVVYKVFMYVMKEWVVDWMEGHGVLGELQHGFRKGRDMGDCLFVVSQLIERSIREDKKMVMGFLDVKKAYDMVDRKKLWKILREMGMREEWVKIMEKLYENNNYIFQWEGIESDKIASERGLRQGCPMSAILFILYMNKLDQGLINTGKGVSLRGLGGRGKRMLPGLMFADDVVVMAESKEDMQILLDVCNRVGVELGLEFSMEKSKVMWINGGGGEKWKLGKGEIEEVEKYDYLGVTFSGRRDYLVEWENKILSKAKRNRGIIKRASYMSYSKYEVVRLLWKGVAVPGIMYGNDVLVMTLSGRKELEKIQKEMGRYALGGRWKVAVEAIQGDMGWSTFEEREMKAKLKRYGKMQLMEENRVCKWVYRECMLGKCKSKWWKRVVQMAGIVDKERLGLYLTLWDGGLKDIVKDINIEGWNREIEKLVREKGKRRWREGIGKKKTLRLYGYKEEIKEEGNLYGNDRGSELLFQARAGDLRTTVRMSVYMKDIDRVCELCGREDEELSHILLDCEVLKNERWKVIEMGGMWRNGERSDEDILRNWLGLDERGDWIEGVKYLLEGWERKAVVIGRD